MNPFISSGSFSSDFPGMLLDAALKSALWLIVVAVAIRAMWRCSAAVRHLALLLAIGSLLVLPLLSRALPRLDVLPSWMATSTVAPKALLAAEPRSSEPIAEAAKVSGPAPAFAFHPALNAPAVVLRAEPQAGPAALGSNPWRWLTAIWALGVLCSLAPAVAGLICLSRLQRKSRVENSGMLIEKLRPWSIRAGVRRIQILTAESCEMPMAWGVFHPKILLPAQAREWPEERRRVVFLHELAHVQRGDFATTLFVRLVCALYWFNPLVWLAARQLRREQERACDDVVLRAGAEPSGYAEEILRIAAGPQGGQLEAMVALAMARPSTLEERLLAILNRAQNRASPTRVSIAIAAALTAVAVIPLSMLQGAQSAATEPAARPAAASATASQRGLIAWWRADGDGKDSVGKHDGEFPFGIGYLPGRVGQAFDFRRSYAIQDLLPRVSIPDSPDFQLSEEMSLEAWIFPQRFGGIVLLRGDDRPGFDTWQLDLITPGKISYNFDDAENKSAAILAPIELEKWHHVVATFERGAMKLYLDGAIAAQTQTNLRPNAILDRAHNPALGIGNTGGKVYNIPFDGLIDEVKIYNRALSAAEIAESARK